LVASVNPDGQDVMTELEDAQGTFTLTPAPSNSFDPRIDSVVFLAGGQTAAPWSSSIVGASVGTTTGVVDAQGADIRAVESPAVETIHLIPPTVFPEPMDPDILVVPTTAGDATLHASVTTFHVGVAFIAATGSLASSGGSALAVAPLASLGFQVSNTAAVSAQASAGIFTWQHVADQLFQTLMRSPTNPSDLTLLSSVVETWEGPPTVRILRLQTTSDNPDSLNWADAGSEVDWQAMGERPIGHDAAPVTSLATDSQVNSQRAALDQYFAQAAENESPIMEDE